MKSDSGKEANVQEQPKSQHQIKEHLFAYYNTERYRNLGLAFFIASSKDPSEFKKESDDLINAFRRGERDYDREK